MATNIRQEITSRAEALAENVDMDVEEEKETGPQRKLQKRELKYSQDKKAKKEMNAAFRASSANPSHPRRKRRTRWQMSANERLQVVKMASTKTKTSKEIAN